MPTSNESNNRVVDIKFNDCRHRKQQGITADFGTINSHSSFLAFESLDFQGTPL
jgi:hypothetical protein